MRASTSKRKLFTFWFWNLCAHPTTSKSTWNNLICCESYKTQTRIVNSWPLRIFFLFEATNLLFIAARAHRKYRKNDDVTDSAQCQSRLIISLAFDVAFQSPTTNVSRRSRARFAIPIFAFEQSSATHIAFFAFVKFAYFWTARWSPSIRLFPFYQNNNYHFLWGDRNPFVAIVFSSDMICQNIWASLMEPYEHDLFDDFVWLCERVSALFGGHMFLWRTKNDRIADRIIEIGKFNWSQRLVRGHARNPARIVCVCSGRVDCISQQLTEAFIIVMHRKYSLLFTRNCILTARWQSPDCSLYILQRK